MNTPVAFLIYRRPDLTARVFARIRAARPPVLLVVADGPRPGEEALCAESRAIVDDIDWPCDVRRNYSDTNMGCRDRVSSGLDWVFSEVEEAIILEDDCLPDGAFFRFCEDLLNDYRDDKRVGHIGGTDSCGTPRDIGASYYFSRYTSIWGWATWRRAWKAYDVAMKGWPQIREQGRHLDLFGTPAEARHFEAVWNDIHSGETDTWDGQWLFACLTNNRLSIAPNGNLVTNIGFRKDARHTVDTGHPFAALPCHPMGFPLQHPEAAVPDTSADRRRAEAEFMRNQGSLRRLSRKLRNKHLYGAALRKLPGIGPAWSAWRGREPRAMP